MKLLSYCRMGETSFGIGKKDGVIDLGLRLKNKLPDKTISNFLSIFDFKYLECTGCIASMKAFLFGISLNFTPAFITLSLLEIALFAHNSLKIGRFTSSFFNSFFI